MNSTRPAASALLFLVALPAAATTYPYTGEVWTPEDMPLPWFQGDVQDDLLDPDYQTEVLNRGFDNWVEQAPCASLSHDYQGVREGDASGYTFDGVNVVYWDDPALDLEGSSALAATLCISDGNTVKEIEGLILEHAYDCDIVFNTNYAWGTTEDLENGLCNGEYSVEETATHEIGHLWGLGHSCETSDDAGTLNEHEAEDVNCTEIDNLTATMIGGGPACVTDGITLGEWDINAINSLYGPFATFTSDSERFGGVPLEVCFTVTANDDITSVDWQFGDGETSTEINPCHTYTSKGQYTVVATINGTTDVPVCATWDYTTRERAYVLVCEAPEPAEGFDGLFTYEPDEGLVYQMINQADTTVYGCVDQVQWDVFDGDTLIQSVNAWSPKIEFPGEGEYRVVLNLGGPGGLSAEELTINVEEGGGCSAVPPGLNLAAALGALGLAVSRRRR